MTHLAILRWPNGFQCPQCGHDHGYCWRDHDRYVCASCHRQTSATSGTLFHATKLPLTQWFWAIYWMGTDKGGISALRLSKLIGENRNGRPGFVAMEAVDSVSMKPLEDFVKRRIKAKQAVRPDGLPANKGVATHVTHISRIKPPEMADQWLPWVHVAIANLKRFLLGTFHGTSKRYLQDYLNEFCYRFNRRFWEAEIPNRLLRLCADHMPVAYRGTVI